ncbi:MAG: class I SAM-dependent methyltransferase [Terrimicrobiaceae bacterium]
MEEKYFKPFAPLRIKQSQLKDVRSAIAEYQAMSAELLAMPQVYVNSCRLCGGEQRTEEITVNGFLWALCADCHHYYKVHMPPHEDVLAWLKKSAPVEVYLREEDFQYRLDNISQPKIDFVSRYHAGPPGRWLDVATGLADIPYRLKQCGWQVDATEINSAFAEFATKNWGITPQQKPLEEYYRDFFAAGQDRFDVVSCFGCFDLQPKPLDHFKIANSLLKPGGLLGINQPNHDSLAGALARHKLGRSLRAFIPGDYSYFSRKSLGWALDHSGFEIVGIWWHGLDMHDLIVQIIDGDPAFKDSDACALLYERYDGLQKVLDESRKSDLLLIAARKVAEVQPD